MMPPAIVMAPMESPKPGAGGGETVADPAGEAPTAMPARAQKASES
jgi:hypothetical protein